MIDFDLEIIFGHVIIVETTRIVGQKNKKTSRQGPSIIVDAENLETKWLIVLAQSKISKALPHLLNSLFVQSTQLVYLHDAI